MKKAISIDVSEEKRFTIYPNPVATSFNLDLNIERDTQITVQVINMVGQVVYNKLQNRTFTQGSYTIPIDTHNWENGIYFVSVVCNGEKETQKLIISR